jgi:hypothetical protein
MQLCSGLWQEAFCTPQGSTMLGVKNQKKMLNKSGKLGMSMAWGREETKVWHIWCGRAGDQKISGVLA